MQHRVIINQVCVCLVIVCDRGFENLRGEDKVCTLALLHVIDDIQEGEGRERRFEQADRHTATHDRAFSAEHETFLALAIRLHLTDEPRALDARLLLTGIILDERDANRR